jgi:hypothetical protein
VDDPCSSAGGFRGRERVRYCEPSRFFALIVADFLGKILFIPLAPQQAGHDHHWRILHTGHYLGNLHCLLGSHPGVSMQAAFHHCTLLEPARVCVLLDISSIEMVGLSYGFLSYNQFCPLSSGTARQATCDARHNVFQIQDNEA